MTETRRVQISVMVNVLVTCDVAWAEGDGATVVSVQSCMTPDADEVMGALDAECRFEELDNLYLEQGEPQ